MSPELIAIIGVGIALLTVQISIAGLLVTLMLQSEKRSNQRIDRLEDRITHELQQFRAETKEQFAAMDERVRGLEQGQARLAAELSLLKDLFTHFLRPERE